MLMFLQIQPQNMLTLILIAKLVHANFLLISPSWGFGPSYSFFSYHSESDHLQLTESKEFAHYKSYVYPKFGGRIIVKQYVIMRLRIFLEYTWETDRHYSYERYAYK